MLAGLIETLKKLGTVRPPFDPGTLGDPVALRTAWSPARGGGANFRTHRLVRTEPHRCEFRPAPGATLFAAFFFLVGAGLVGAIAYAAARTPRDTEPMAIAVAMFIGLVFATIGAGMLYAGRTPIVFDKSSGWFWKGRKDPEHVFDRSKLKNFAPLRDVHALQLLSEYCRGNKHSYYSFELNLILGDGRRINVVDHGSREKLREDAAALAAFLGKPLWDATGP